MGRAQNVPGPSLGRALWGITLEACWRPQPGFLREQRWEGWWLDGGEQGALPEKK